MDHFRYRRSARFLHWLMALLLLLTIPAGLLMTRGGVDGRLQDALFIYHKNVGVLLFILVVIRLALRWRNPPPPRTAALPAWQDRIAGTTHRLLYALLLVLPIAGYLRVRAGGFPIESLDALGAPLLVPLSEELAVTAKALHYWAGVVLIALITVHAGAAMHHRIVRRDGTLARMWPPLGR